MSSDQPAPYVSKVSVPAFKGIIWAFTAVALPFLALRLYVRRVVFHQFYADDFVVLITWLLLLAYAIVWQIFSEDLYTTVASSTGATPGPGFLDAVARFQRAEAVSQFLFAFCIWGIKLNFLLFFRRLGHNVTKQKLSWPIIAGYTFATFAVWMGLVQWQCLIGPVEQTIARCAGPDTADRGQIVVKAQTAMDVTSDAAILVLPMSLLWNVHITFRRKLVLGGIFGLTLFVMIASIVRAVEVVSQASGPDDSWMFSWNSIEMSVAIIVACIASFKALFSSMTLSQKLPEYQRQEREIESERQALRHLGFLSGGKFIPKSKAMDPYRQFTTTTNTQIHAGTSEDHEMKPIQGPDGPAGGREVENISSDKIYVRREVIVEGGTS